MSVVPLCYLWMGYTSLGETKVLVRFWKLCCTKPGGVFHVQCVANNSLDWLRVFLWSSSINMLLCVNIPVPVSSKFHSRNLTVEPWLQVLEQFILNCQCLLFSRYLCPHSLWEITLIMGSRPIPHRFPIWEPPIFFRTIRTMETDNSTRFNVTSSHKQHLCPPLEPRLRPHSLHQAHQYPWGRTWAHGSLAMGVDTRSLVRRHPVAFTTRVFSTRPPLTLLWAPIIRVATPWGPMRHRPIPLVTLSLLLARHRCSITNLIGLCPTDISYPHPTWMISFTMSIWLERCNTTTLPCSSNFPTTPPHSSHLNSTCPWLTLSWWTETVEATCWIHEPTADLETVTQASGEWADCREGGAIIRLRIKPHPLLVKVFLWLPLPLPHLVLSALFRCRLPQTPPDFRLVQLRCPIRTTLAFCFTSWRCSQTRPFNKPLRALGTWTNLRTMRLF